MNTQQETLTIVLNNVDTELLKSAFESAAFHAKEVFGVEEYEKESVLTLDASAVLNAYPKMILDLIAASLAANTVMKHLEKKNK